MSSDDAPLWTRQPDESAKAFQAFAMYRDMSVERSTYKVARELGKSVALIQRWAALYAWVARAADYDANVAEMGRKVAEQQHLDAMRAFRQRCLDRAKRMGDAGEKLTERVLARLVGFDEGEGTTAAQARAAAALLKEALNAEALALGVDDLVRTLGE